MKKDFFKNFALNITKRKNRKMNVRCKIKLQKVVNTLDM